MGELTSSLSAERSRVWGFLAALVLTLAAAMPATATPLDGLQSLVGPWTCTYRAGTTSLTYGATYAYDLDGHTLRQIDSWTGGGGAEELVAYDGHSRTWTAVVFDDHGNTTVMHAKGGDANHIAYRSVYPDASVAVTFDRVSATTYLLHGAVHSAGKTIASVDTCLRGTH